MQIADMRESGYSAHTDLEIKPDTIGSGSRLGERIHFHAGHEKQSNPNAGLRLNQV